MVQLQRQSSAIGSGLPTVHSGTTLSSSSSTAPFSGTQPGLSAFLTSDTLDDYGVSGLKQGITSNNSNTHSFGLGSHSSSSSLTHHQQSGNSQLHGGGGGLSSSTVQHQLSAPSSEIHPLHFNWVFWFMHRAPGSRILNYESSMKKIASFGSVSLKIFFF